MKNLGRLLRKLDQLGGNAERALISGVRDGTRLVQGDAKELAAVKTGRLHNSIVAKTEVTRDRIVGTVSTNVEYAPFVELGTGGRGEASPSPPKHPDISAYDPAHAGMPAQPFLYPAAVAGRKRVPALIARRINDEIRRMGGK